MSQDDKKTQKQLIEELAAVEPGELKELRKRAKHNTAEIAALRDELTAMGSGKGFMKLLTELAKRQRQMEEALREVTGRKFDVVLPSGLRE